MNRLSLGSLSSLSIPTSISARYTMFIRIKQMTMPIVQSQSRQSRKQPTRHYTKRSSGSLSIKKGDLIGLQLTDSQIVIRKLDKKK
ncbi:MAG: hypothetical protein ACW97V_20030 [Promethearchaeota archaeon]|jgi:hypothetical protein